MKRYFVIFALLIGLISNAQKEEVQKTIEIFFDGFHKRDTIKLKSVCSEKLVLQSISESVKGTKFSEENRSDFYKSIATIPADVKFEEKILDYSIQMDGMMANAWTSYEFYINGKLSHKGVNSFTLFKESEELGWKIVHLIDTRRK
jgi:hypothetical protein